MPPFPPDVQDLIYKMLTVDPAKRITINEIKQHPCFRRNLPTNYILPSPIPFTSVSNAINMSELSPNIISVLTQIGFSNINELKSDLESTDNTMAKVFVHMLTSNYDLDQLPWDEFSTSHEHSAHFDSNSFIINPTQHEPTPFHPTNANTNSASFDANSFASHPSWDYESTNVTSIILERNIEISGRTIWHVMCGVQEAADDCGLQWFHPNRITMYVRTNDATFYGSVIGEYISENKISVKVRMHKGIETQFVDFAERILQVMGLSVT
ncbi:putative CAMK family protein kinase [Histomonas meleagridis]